MFSIFDRFLCIAFGISFWVFLSMLLLLECHSCTHQSQLTVVKHLESFVRIVGSDDASPLARLVQSHHHAERCSLHGHPTTSIVFLCLHICEALARIFRTSVYRPVIDLFTSSSSVHFNRVPPKSGIRSPDAVMWPLLQRFCSRLLSAISKGHAVTAAPMSKLNVTQLDSFTC